jgi:hypothetical protein
MEYLNNVAIMFYSFQHRTGEAFAKAIDDAGAASNWRSTTAMLPNLYAEELSTLARDYGAVDLNFQALVDAGKMWFDKLVDQKMRVIALVILLGVPEQNEIVGTRK